MLERWSGIWYNGRESGHGKRSAPPARETASLTQEKPAGPGQRTEKGADGMERYRVLLVDDIITTGATVSACALALQQAGAYEITAAAVAATEELPKSLQKSTEKRK